MNRHFLKRNAFVPIMAAVFAIYWPSVCVSQDIPSQAIQKVVESPKLLRPQEIVQPLEEGESTTRIIVTLKKPLSAKGVKNLKDLSVRRELAQTVGRVQARVLSKLDPDEVHITNRFTYIFGFSARVSLKGLQALIDNPDVASIEKDQILHAHLAQGIPLMDATTPRSSYNGSGVSVAICDTGIDYTHSKLGNGGFPNSKVIGGYDTGEEDTNPMDGNGHGTACAGIAAGDLGIYGDYIGGVAYNARLYALKITYDMSGGSARTSAMIGAWEWCITHQYDDPNNPIMVISTSFGGGRYYSTCDGVSSAMTAAAANAVSAGMTLFVSSGNDGYCDSVGWPACISYVNSVGAVYDNAFGSYWPCVSQYSCAETFWTPDSCDSTSGYYAKDSTSANMVTSYSNTYSLLNLLAPSNQAYTTDITGFGGYNINGNYYSSFGGTSAACPYAAGAAACLQSASKTITGSFMTPAQVKSTLADTGDSITDGKISITKPRVNLQAAVATLESPCPPCPPSGNITNARYRDGSNCTCTHDVALTIGANVVIEAGATVTFTAPVVTFLPGSRVEEGATLNVGQ